MIVYQQLQMLHLQSFNALFRRAVEARTLADFADYLSSKTSGAISKTSREVVYEISSPMMDESNYSFYTFTAVRGPFFSAHHFLDALSRRLLIRSKLVEDADGSQTLAVELRPWQEGTASIFPVNRRQSFAKVRFHFFYPHYDVIKGPLFEEVVSDIFRHDDSRDEAGVVGHTLNYRRPMCYYKNPRYRPELFDLFVAFCRDVVAEKVQEQDETDVALALYKYFKVNVSSRDVITFKDVRNWFMSKKPTLDDDYQVFVNRFSIAVEVMRDTVNANLAYFNYVNDAKKTRDYFATQLYHVAFPMEILNNVQLRILTRTFEENLLSGVWPSLNELRAAVDDTAEALRSKDTFSQIKTRDAILLEQFDIIEQLKDRMQTPETHVDYDEPFDEVKFKGIVFGDTVELTFFNRPGQRILRTDATAPKNLAIRKTGGEIKIQAWMCASWNQAEPLNSLEFVPLIDLDAEASRPNRKTCNVFVEVATDEITEQWHCWVSGSFGNHVFRRIEKSSTFRDKTRSRKDITIRDAQGFLHSPNNFMPACIEIDLTYSQILKDWEESARRVEFWSHGQLHCDGKAAVQWYSYQTAINAQVWRRGMAFVSARPLFTSAARDTLKHPVLQAGGSCYIAAMFNLLFNSPVLKNALVSSINREIALDPAILRNFQGPLVTGDNAFLIRQAAFQMLCSDTERSPQETLAITSAFSDKLCRFGGYGVKELETVFTTQFGLTPEIDYKFVVFNMPHSNDNLFADAVAATPPGFKMLGVLLTYRVADSATYHEIAGVNFENRSLNFIFDSNGIEHHYDWVNQPSTGILNAGDTFGAANYVLVSKAFYDANIVKTVENRCQHTFRVYTSRE
jgi:hypothetical protein